MKVRTEPLLGGAAFSFILLLISNLISTFITYNNINRSVQSMMSGAFDPFMTQASVFSSMVGLISCLVIPVAGLGSGVIYAVLHNRQEQLAGAPAKGGAAAGALGFFLSGLVSAILAGLLVIPVMNQMNQMIFARVGAVDPSMAGLTNSITGFGIAGAFIGGICGGVVFALLGAILGALGSLLGKSFAGPKPAAA